MTSVLNVDTIADKAGTGPVALTKQSAAKMWANLNGSTFGLRQSFNTSSATDNGTGDYTFSFTNSTSDSDYATTINQGNQTGSDFWGYRGSHSHATGSVREKSRNTSNSAADAVTFCVHLQGDLA
jgi:hypothetical protein